MTDRLGMQLTQEDIQEFKQIYESEFGEVLSYAEAEECAQRLLSLYELLASDSESKPEMGVVLYNGNDVEKPSTRSSKTESNN